MKRVLIADDDPVMARLIEFNMSKAGYDVVVCREGLSVMATAKETKPALAIFDLMLPGRTGLELIESFKDDEKLKDVPLIVVTGQGKESIREELMAAGASVVFTKPFSPTILVSTVADILSE